MGFRWMDLASNKRQKHGNEQTNSPGTQFQSSILSNNRRVCLQFLEQYNELKYGSVTKGLEAIHIKRRELIGILEKLQQVPIRLPYSSPVLKSSDATLYNFGQSGSNYSSANIIDLDADEDNFGDDNYANVGNTGADATFLAVDSDIEDGVQSFGGENSPSKQHENFIQQQLLPEQPVEHQEIIILDNVNSSTEPQVSVKRGKDIMDPDNVSDKPNKIALFDSDSTSVQQSLIKQGHGHIKTTNESHHKEKGKIEKTIEKDIDSYEVSSEVVQTEPQSNGINHHDKGSPVDELEDLWRDMSVALACSKTIGSNQSIVPSEKNTCEEMEDACNHDFLMKDDLGIVCRVCGLIEQRIENTFEYSWKKRKQSYKTYPSEHRNSSDPDATGNPSAMVLKVVPDTLSIHPQHSQHMKPHQMEGFNFLIKNLADENNPGGCILAHAPGSGKTFMLISFVHSFLNRYPAGRPLIVLPRGILGTWKSEFLRWQVENIPLYDFYSSKANNRSEQLKVLKLWEEYRSILLIGYQKFEHIVSDDSSDSEAIMCREKLLKVPSLVILDEGHTSRNDQTELLSALETIQTPRKVVLSGTLFQNHVSEVFNILNLVRPKFLKMQKSRAIMKRILTKVDMLGKSVRAKNISEKVFYELIEENLQKDSKTMKVMIIQNLRELTKNVLHYYQGEILKELPGLVDFTVLLNMSTKQDNIIKGLVGTNKFEAHAKCNAVSLHPCLKDVKNVDKKNRNISKRKMELIIRGIDINDGVKAKFIYNLLSLSEAAGEKVLVFSQYVRSLDFLETLVTKMKGWKSGVNTFQMNGGLTNDQREQAVERFNNSPDAKVFFGSIKACGEGISLVGASRVVILDVHENPAVMRQAIGRAFRPGQSKMVYCYRLVAAGSLEEEHHNTAFKKERVSKLWFEWNELSSNEDFELAEVDVSGTEDRFLESPALREDIKSLLKR
ncbi:protein CHROMATIN REMODELING 35-like isoform X2 [Phragmites australis]|uniref:protein CHROMATIN REMODELING 35-like isoform X2 n=1 Tax=Phragmites australis TaxID=29695 RepID=UPI002D76CD81|nr:protein CHROMATIN REMODELING 35-like isoform X2 [Phragmites australis]